MQTHKCHAHVIFIDLVETRNILTEMFEFVKQYGDGDK
jgi:hypothetical protein